MGGVEGGGDAVFLGLGKGTTGEIEHLKGAPGGEIGGKTRDVGAGEVEPFQPGAQVVRNCLDGVAGQDQMAEGGRFCRCFRKGVVRQIEAFHGVG